jgi:hypothetical protein
MASTPEVKAKAKILKSLRSTTERLGYKLWLETHAGDAFSTPTLDITGVVQHPGSLHYGVPFAVEVKRFDGKGKVTGRQEQTIDAMRSAGIAVFVVDSDATLSQFLAWIESLWPITSLLCIKGT